MMEEAYSWLRVKYILSTNISTILVVCLLTVSFSVLILLTGVLTSPIQQSPFADESDSELSFHAASIEQHANVTVTENTTAYTAGQTLTDTSLYPLQNASNPTIRSRASVDKATITNLSVMLTYEATRNTDQTARFYSKTIHLATVNPDAGTATAETTLPVQEVLNEVTRLQQEFGGGVTVSTTLTSQVTYHYDTAPGRQQTERLTVGGPIDRVGNLYSLPSETDRVTHQTGERDPSPSSADAILNWIIGIIGITAVLLGIVTAGTAHVIDSTAVAQELQRERFREWVTEVESYTPQGQVNTVEVTSLNDLVNLAIDTNRRVLYHQAVQEYIVIEGNILYKYIPETDEASGSTELFGLSEENLETTEFPSIPDIETDEPQ